MTAQVTPEVSALRVCGFMETALERLVTALEATPERALNSIDVMPAAERQQVVNSWNATKTRQPAQLLPQLFEAQAAKTPQAVAAMHGTAQLSYAELNRQANQLAHHLRQLGVKRNDRIALQLERSLPLLVAILAILKCGAAYVPIDASLPDERKIFMANDSNAAMLLAHSAGRWPALAALPRIDLDHIAASAYAADNLTPGGDDETIAYIMYTSGSTGQPKGVMVPHRGIKRLVLENGYAAFDASDRIAFAANPAFDASTVEIWGALLNGGRVVVIDKEVFLDPLHLAGALERQGITTLFLTTAVFNQCAAAAPDAFGRLRFLMTGGERCDPAAFARVLEAGRPQHLIHCYGPTEATTYATTYEVSAVDASQATIPIGRPIASTQVYLLDTQGEPVPVGVAGEMYIGGAGIARGYLNREALTAERFIPDRFSGQPGALLYRTGDLALWQADGNLVHLGRNDFQVKIRGFRIELGEIEARLASHPAVREAVVIAREDSPGNKRLVAYIVASEEIDAAALRSHLSVSMPEYMVPAAYVMLAALPLTPNGKLDRKHLPAPEADAYAASGYVAPEGETETALAAIWSQLLRVERIGRHDNFFSLGGHSLVAVQMISRIRQAFAIEVAISTLFAYPVLLDFSAQLLAGGQSVRPPLTAATGAEREQLSFAQQRLWFLEQMGGVSHAYHIPLGLQLRGELDRVALVQALERLVFRHEALRTSFVAKEGHGAVQRVAAADVSHFHLLEHDLRHHPEREAELERLLAVEAARPFDLAQGPLIRGLLLQETRTRHTLLITAHHIVSDGWSTAILLDEISALYNAYREGRHDPLPPLTVQYPDYAAWQRRWMSGAVLEQQAAYWKQSLAGAPTLLEVPADYPRPPQQDYAGSSIDTTLDATLTRKLKALSQRHGSTLYMTLLGSWALLLGRLAGQDDIVIGTPAANRSQQEAEGLIGFFVNTLALRIRLPENATVASLLAHVRQQALAAQQHQEIPFEQVVEHTHPVRSMAHSPLFQVMFAWQNAPQGKLQLSGLELAPLGVRQVTAKFDLTLALGESGDAVTGSLEYATALFEPGTVQRYLGYWHRLLQAMVADDGQQIASLPLPGEAERQLLDRWNATQVTYPERASLLHQLCEAQAARTPQAVAVEQGTQQLSYAELNRQANQLAHYLRELGVRPDDRVAICAERSLAMVVALLAVLKAGAAYVPLDPAYPADRLTHMLSDSGPRVVLTQAGIKGGWQQVRATIAPDLPVLDLLAASWAAYPDHNPDSSHLTPSDLAYVIYTSGSTGKPKGVMNEHRGVVNRMLWMQQAYGLAQHDVVLQKTPFSFDVSVWEFFWPLMVGAKLVMAKPDGHKDPRYLSELIRAAGVTTLHFVPSMLQVFAAHGEAADCSSIVRVMCSGEALPAALVRSFHALLPQAQLHNLYGPTEAAVDVTAWTAVAGETRSLIPIGKPIANTSIHILDALGQPVPIGVAGELHIGGVQVARGYLNRPDLTEQRFIADPFSPLPGARLYKTGDLARWQPDGNLVYLGRNDFQVKIRGFRIELGEIEAQLAAHAAIREAVVIVREDTPGDQRLVAYIVADQEVDAAALRTHLGLSLPDYMVPAAYVTLAALPLTPNGKLDRKNLPAPAGDAYAFTGYAAPEGTTETILAAIWSELLQIERIGRHDNFFSLGGHSLLAVTLVEKMRQQGMQAEVRALFAAPTLAGLAAAIGAESRLVAAPPSLIPAGCEFITPAMLPMVALSAAEIAHVVGKVPGGAANVQDIYPLAPLQEGILFHHMMAKEGDPYLLVGMTAFDTRERLESYLTALQSVIQRHDVLRTAIVWEGVPEPLQVVWRSAPLVQEELTLDPADGDVAGQLRARFDPRHTRLDLSQAPLMRTSFAYDAPQKRWVLLTLIHHLVNDHTTLEVMRAEIAAHLLGQEAQLPAPLQFRNHVAQARSGAGTEAHETFFRRMLGDVDEPTASRNGP